MAGERILIVDDTPVSLKVSQVLLSREGYEVRTAASAEEGLEILHGFQPRLVLTDVQLPGMDGLELARRLKQDAATRDILVVAVTASATPEGEGKALAAGCDGYMAKRVEDLIPQIRGYLGSGEARHAGEVDFQPLRARFAAEVDGCVAHWLEDLDEFDAEAASRTLHQWAGTAGLLGYAHAGWLARELEAVLRERPLDVAQLRDAFTSLAGEFREPK